MFLIKYLLIPFVVVNWSFPVEAAVPQKIRVKTELFEAQKLQDQKAYRQTVITALRLPLQNRLQALQNQSKKNLIPELKALAIDNEESLQARWRSITALAALAPKTSEGFLIEMLQRPEWFLRNAAAVALSQVDRGVAVKWATKLLNDPALVVRTAAVDILFHHRGIEAESILWEKLYSDENFRHGKSLWIRKRIAKTLATFANKGQELKFIKLLQDEDPWLHKYGVEALEKITGYVFEKGSDLENKRQKWLSWASQS